MPELPEVETTLRGIEPFLTNQNLSRLQVRNRSLRWPVEHGLESAVANRRIKYLQRRGKYILIHFDQGGLIIHLGMSGSMRVLFENEVSGPHDHFDLVTERGVIIRYRDPRRFGCLLYVDAQVESHDRLIDLGVEPLTDDLTGKYLYDQAKAKRTSVKVLIMNGKIVVGVGNIYASESLFAAGIHPARRCDRVSQLRYENLAISIKRILHRSIKQGGTTLQDFVGADGSPGYFEQKLAVYGRKGEACFRCGGEVRSVVLGQRSTFYCAVCQR
ncbi:MAG: bifunctional DNA-formamidopyrimidine glycosylase/DNA-(apurinic or apyrimidinic site) lyase [Gammaproteobacteria bacterium]|nr:bifunctional DNA-formamidopyrimidine glycosylase/DNA-(apurinic or apyrimidinic site) lyase [Gammaproteobacteria bacterium]